jgi:GNAT superfamily N-acetyltransferase
VLTLATVWPPRPLSGCGVEEARWRPDFGGSGKTPRAGTPTRSGCSARPTALTPPAPGAPVADEWWRVVDGAGAIVGYGWLDSEWGDAEVTFLVAPDRRGEGIGEFIIDRLEAEAAARGLNYIYNVVPVTSPDPEWVTSWLVRHGFVAGDGDLRRRVPDAVAG